MKYLLAFALALLCGCQKQPTADPALAARVTALEEWREKQHQFNVQVNSNIIGLSDLMEQQSEANVKIVTSLSNLWTTTSNVVVRR